MRKNSSLLAAALVTAPLFGCRAGSPESVGSGQDATQGRDAAEMGAAGSGGVSVEGGVDHAGSAPTVDAPGFSANHDARVDSDNSPAPDRTSMAVEAGDLGPAAVINGQRWEVLCSNPVGGDETCINAPQAGCPPGGRYNLNKTVTFGGNPGTIYDVTVRIRGLVEPKIYVGGKSDGKHFYVGGGPESDHFNLYSMSVSSPKQVYYLNSDEGKGVSHYVFPIDHMKTIQIEGGATIKMVAFDSNCLAIGNCMKAGPGCTSMPYIIPGVPPYPKAWNGQFVQLDVISVTP